ncbi:MAG: anti-sigma F factor [Clostridia bacterium]|nr:anti-sigma F factor [Clostridia bacterium]
MKRIINEMKLRLPAVSINESVARSCISSFMAELDPTVEELCDMRCAVSEAVTNVIVHAYKNHPEGTPAFIYISARLYNEREITVEVSDNGCGIEDIERARAPMFTTGEPGERCGMGFLVMESFTDSLTVKSRVGKGTTVLMRKILGKGEGAPRDDGKRS